MVRYGRGAPDTRVTAVTVVLTSMSEDDLAAVGLPAVAGRRPPPAALAVGGCPRDRLLATGRSPPPAEGRRRRGAHSGVRPAGAALGDQQRVATPSRRSPTASTCS